MNNYDLLEALGEIDDTMLIQCEEYVAQIAKRRKLLIRGAAGICAVLALAVGLQSLPSYNAGADAIENTVIDAENETQQMPNTDLPLDYYGTVSPTYNYADTVEDAAEITTSVLENNAIYDQTSPQPEVDSAADDAEAKKDHIAEEEVEWDVPPEVDASADEAVDIPAEEPLEEPADIPAADSMDKILSAETETGSTALPIIPVEEIKGDFGFEGILLYEDDVHCNYNLLDMYGTPETLPVYKNLAFYDLSGKPVYLSDDTMLEMGQSYAALLGFEVLSYETGYAWDEEDIPGDVLILETTGGEIRVQGNGMTTVDFAEPIALTGDRKLNGDTSLSAAEKTIGYLWEQYGMLLDGDDGQYSVTFDRTFSGEGNRRYEVFSVSDDVGQNYYNASFANLWFFSGETDDTLGGIHIRNQAGALEKIGDYPLISEEEATEMLFAGEYITTVPEDYLPAGGFTEDDILSCELEYRPSNLDTYYIPYYHYYVRLDRFPENYAEGLESYGGFWVPAVHPDYLDTSMVTDGRFN